MSEHEDPSDHLNMRSVIHVRKAVDLEIAMSVDRERTGVPAQRGCRALETRTYRPGRRETSDKPTPHQCLGRRAVGGLRKSILICGYTHHAIDCRDVHR